MQVTPQMVEQLAHLSRLEFSGPEKEAIRSDLEKMISFVEKLNELDTTGIEPLRHMSQAANVLRPDVVAPGITVQQALQNAPHADGNYFLVPKVIRK